MSLNGIFPIDNWNFHSKTILMDLEEEDRLALMQHAREERYVKGALIFREGGKPVGIYYIQSGTVKKYKVDNSGKEHIFYVANAGELIGYHALLADEPYPDAAAALQDSMISFIPAKDFLDILNRSPHMSRRLLKILSHEFAVYINNLSVFAQRPVKERVAIALIILREKFKQPDHPGRPVLISISRDDIANMAGTTRENVARVISELKQEQIIETVGRKIRITDVRQLVNVANYTG